MTQKREIKLTKDYIVYRSDTLNILGKFFLKQAAEKKARRISRLHGYGSVLRVDYLDVMTEDQWRMWKLLSR